MVALTIVMKQEQPCKVDCFTAGAPHLLAITLAGNKEALGHQPLHPALTGHTRCGHTRCGCLAK